MGSPVIRSQPQSPQLLSLEMLKDLVDRLNPGTTTQLYIEIQNAIIAVRSTRNCTTCERYDGHPVPKRTLLKRTANILRIIVEATFEFACYSQAPFVYITDCILRLVIYKTLE